MTGATDVFAPAAPGVARLGENSLLDRVLAPYREHTTYLRSAVVQQAEEGLLTTQGTFAVPYSCYIDDTGHFNSVELNICYNQALYFTLAHGVAAGLIPTLAHWTLDDFWRKQLPDVLITDFHSTFRRQMSGREFRGLLSIERESSWRRTDLQDDLVVLDTVARFWDADDGSCGAEARIAITDPGVPR